MIEKNRTFGTLSGIAIALVAVSTQGASANEKHVPPTPESRSAVRPSQEFSPVPESPQEEETRLSKNWGGARSRLSEKGVDLALIYKGDTIHGFAGGVEAGKTAYRGNLDLRLSLDLERVAGAKGLSAFVYGLLDHGGAPSAFIGSGQGTSNIETVAPYSAKVYEAWVQQLFHDDRVSMLLGLHDLNSEFYVTDTSTLFLNPSFGIGAELATASPTGPSIFPTTSPALRLRAEPSKAFYVQWAAFGAVSGDPEQPRGTQVSLNAADGFLLISEAAYLRGAEGSSAELPAKYGIGVWTYTRPFPHLTATVTNAAGETVAEGSSNHGAYLLADQSLTENVQIFARYGVAATTVNRFASCLSAGVVHTGLIPSRPKDHFGLAFTRARNGGEFIAAQTAESVAPLEAETTIEASYRLQLIPGVALQPDLQYVIQPGTDPALANAVVGTLRAELNF